MSDTKATPKINNTGGNSSNVSSFQAKIDLLQKMKNVPVVGGKKDNDFLIGFIVMIIIILTVFLIAGFG